MTDQLQRENILHFIREGPRMSTVYNVWVVAKDTKNELVKLGGLGACGVGEMVLPTQERHKQYTNYKEAPDTDLSTQVLKWVTR